MSDAFNAIVTPVPTAMQGEPGCGALSDLRIGVKDNIAVAGVRSTCASAFFVDSRPATQDSDVVAALKREGAQITATLNMAEFAVGVTSQNSQFGGPLNPWDITRVPGGSSGGSAVAVATGAVDVALGTDTGGSIRLPASCCGVVGLRPTSGSVSTAGVFPVSRDFDTVGPLARTVDEVRQVFEVLAGRHTEPEHAHHIAVPSPFITGDIDPAITSALDSVVHLLGEIGYAIDDSPVPLADTAQDVVYTLIYSDLARLHADRLAEAPEKFQRATFERISLGQAITVHQRASAISRRDLFQAAMKEYFESVDVVVTPTMPVDVPIISESQSVLPISRRMGQLSYPWSLHTGPTLSVPIGFHPESGMPIGAQLTAAPGREALLFNVAGAIQAHTAWHHRRPPGIG